MYHQGHAILYQLCFWSPSAWLLINRYTYDAQLSQSGRSIKAREAHQRDHLLRANDPSYFAQTTPHCHALKLFKLLQLFDFEHYRQAGRPVTRQTYIAWSLGPIPLSLGKEMSRGGRNDLRRAVAFADEGEQVIDKRLRDVSPALLEPPWPLLQALEEVPSERYVDRGVKEPSPRRLTPGEWLAEVKFTDRLWWTALQPRATFDVKLFSRRELDIMDRLAEFLGYIQGADMSELPETWQLSWRKIYGQGWGAGKVIPLSIALEGDAIIADVPTIEPDEIRYREELLDGLT